MSNSGVLTVDGLSKHFPMTSGIFGRHAGVVKAVDDVSFDVEQGQALALVGDPDVEKQRLRACC